MTQALPLKRLPQDLTIEELGSVPLGTGDYEVYKLSKRGLGTREAMDLVAREWKLTRDQIAWGGIRDKTAISEQTVTIKKGQAGNFKKATVELVHVGQSPRPIEASNVLGNRFKLTIRGVDSRAQERMTRELGEIGRKGAINYIAPIGDVPCWSLADHVTKCWIEENYEKALRTAFAEPAPGDSQSESAQKQLLAKSWGKWADAKNLLAKSHRRSVVTYLCDHPTDFRNAFLIIRRELRTLWLLDFQNQLWNRALDEAIARKLPIAKLMIPLPSARSPIREPELAEVYAAVLKPLGLDISRLKIRHGRDVFFSRGTRAALLLPQNFTHEWGDDDLNAGKRALRLTFELPRTSDPARLLEQLQSIAR